jgi:hypothetical protein
VEYAKSKLAVVDRWTNEYVEEARDDQDDYLKVVKK